MEGIHIKAICPLCQMQVGRSRPRDLFSSYNRFVCCIILRLGGSISVLPADPFPFLKIACPSARWSLCMWEKLADIALPTLPGAGKCWRDALLFPLKEAFGSLRQWAIKPYCSWQGFFVVHLYFITHFTIYSPGIIIVHYHRIIISPLCSTSPHCFLHLPRCNQDRGLRIPHSLSFSPPTKGSIIVPDPCKVVSNKSRGK
jgi:hypothetical protein